jgi:hypothetical protein
MKHIKDFEAFINEQKTNEAEVTTIPNFNKESDVAIVMMDELKGDRKFNSIIEKYGIDYYSGANPKNIIASLKAELLKGIVDDDFVYKIVDITNEKHKRNILEPSLVTGNLPKAAEMMASVLAMAIIFNLRESPVHFAKEIKSKKLEAAADAFSVERGKEKFGAILQNKFPNLQ